MATTSPFDPDKVDPEFYSHDPGQHGDSESGGTEVTTDPDTEQPVAMLHDADGNEATQVWDVDADTINDANVPKGQMMSDEAGKKLSEIAENPSDDALFHRADATYLEEGDNPNEGYDPHNKGYDSKDKTNAQ